MDSSPDETKPIVPRDDFSSPNYRGFKNKWKGRDFRPSPDSASKLKAAKDAWRQSYGATHESPAESSISPGIELKSLSGSSVDEFRALRDEHLSTDNTRPASLKDWDDYDDHDDPACAVSHDGHHHHRYLAYYQIGLILLILVCWWTFLWNHDIFRVNESIYDIGPPALKDHDVASFEAAFHPPPGAKKGAADPDPDLVFFQTPSVDSWFGGEEGTWVWAHGELYLMLPTSFLHAVSGTLMDPAYSTTKLSVDHESLPHCFTTPDGTEDRRKCLESLIGPLLDAEQPPKGGYFAFATRQEMHIFHYETSKGIKITPVEQSQIWKYTVMMIATCVVVALIGGTSITAGVVYMAQHKHKEFLKEYIAKALFMHDPHHHALYDETLAEVHDEHLAEERANADDDPEDHQAMSDAHPAVVNARKKIEKKLRRKIYETQGVLHVVSEYARGGKSRKVASNPDLDAVVEPSMCSQLLERTQETLAHAIIMIVTCSPILICNVLFKQGLVQFGTFGLDSGLLPPHSVVYYLHLFMLVSSVCCWILLCSLIFHYLTQEFGEGSPGSTWFSFSHNPAVHFLFTTWTGFAYLQAVMLWMSSVVVVLYVLTGGMGLILHLFTNMFMVTAILGVVTTCYFQYVFVSGIVGEVHAEIHHAQVIMDDLVDALGKRLMHLRLKKIDARENPEKAAAQKKKISRIQKAILMVQSAFSNCVTHELHNHGFGPKEFLAQLAVALTGAAVVVLIIYSGMKAAHAFGKAVQAAGSALAGGAFALMNASKEKPKKGKGPPKFPPKIQLAIDGLNEALMLTVQDSVCDLVYMLRREHHCVELVTAAIDQAEKELKEEKEDKWAQKNAQAFLAHAKDGLKDGQKKVKKWLKAKGLKEGHPHSAK